jgi:response regulator of citrate/malate metabolism
LARVDLADHFRLAWRNQRREDVDDDFMAAKVHRAYTERVPGLPKNLNRPTLELVVRCLRDHPETVSALEVAEGTGVSRGTARRYLDYLESRGRASLELRYGSAGRPEHRYRLKPSN